MPDSTRVEAGYKATLANPRVSEGAKQHARQELEARGVDVPGTHERQETGSSTESKDDAPTGHDGNVVRGLKAALHNKNVSDEAKESVKEKLEAHGVDPKCVVEHSAA